MRQQSGWNPVPNGHNEPGWSRRVQTVPFEDIGRLGVSDDGRTLYLVREASYGQRRNFSETPAASNTRIRDDQPSLSG